MAVDVLFSCICCLIFLYFFTVDVHSVCCRCEIKKKNKKNTSCSFFRSLKRTRTFRVSVNTSFFKKISALRV